MNPSFLRRQTNLWPTALLFALLGLLASPLSAQINLFDKAGGGLGDPEEVDHATWTISVEPSEYRRPSINRPVNSSTMTTSPSLTT